MRCKEISQLYDTRNVQRGKLKEGNKNGLEAALDALNFDMINKRSSSIENSSRSESDQRSLQTLMLIAASGTSIWKRIISKSGVQSDTLVRMVLSAKLLSASLWK